ncbi:MAG: DUF1186 domain-containing protein, partial [Bacteroidetes bacterium]|nr:DUF1186 domain-containing protein [Bacteroidota bacterium]
KLTDLIVKYPQSPQLKNFLSAAYSVKGNFKKATEVNQVILTEHPDYLFAKLNLANQYITEGKLKKVTEILGTSMEIKELYPDRDLFHLAEVSGFYKVAIRYYAAINDLEMAENRFLVLQEIAPMHPDTETAENFIFPLRIKKNQALWEDEAANSINVSCTRPVPIIKQTLAPVFSNQQIKYLYEYGLGIPEKNLKEILVLPRESLIADLEIVLKDAVNRYLYFVEFNRDETKESFPLHAICLLGELKSENSLPLILDLLENNEKLLDYWFGDHISETIWHPIYLLSQNNLELLKQFLLKPGITTYSKLAVTEVLSQTAHHQPEKRKKIAHIYQELLSFFIKSDQKDNVIDSEFNGLIVGDIIDCGFKELLPLIKELYDIKRVSPTINGSYEEVVDYFNKPLGMNPKRKITNIFELYKNILTTWASYTDDDFYGNQKQATELSVKIGRNEPCPCGSGKKYKKCCLNQ